MSDDPLAILQSKIQAKDSFRTLQDYIQFALSFLEFLESVKLTRIISPQMTNYIFYQYGEAQGYVITRPLNTHLFYESDEEMRVCCERFLEHLIAIKRTQGDPNAIPKDIWQRNDINRAVYTLQQSIGCIGDSLTGPNQARKRVGQLFEHLVQLILTEVGVECKSRIIRIPIPGLEGHKMSYELDIVFSRNQAIITAETTDKFIHPSEIVGSIKTTSKDRIDKIFLDKYLLAQLLERDIPVVAIFLHDVQRAGIKASIKLGRPPSQFGISSTFKNNHFLGYTVAFRKLDGVYYVDPLPIMRSHKLLKEQIFDFQQFITRDLWTLLDRTS